MFYLSIEVNIKNLLSYFAVYHRETGNNEMNKKQKIRQMVGSAMDRE